jgi:hypothetical protein
MTSDQTIASYRAAAKWLEEAPQQTDPEAAFYRVAYAYDSLGTDEVRVSDALSILYEKDLWRENTPGASWLTEAGRMRLLLEALILEQEQSAATAREMGWYASQDDLEDLGALVRRVLLAGPTAATTAASVAPVPPVAP